MHLGGLFPAITLRRRSVVVTILLTLVTFGYYIPVWYLRRRKGFNALESPTKLGLHGPIMLLVLMALWDLLPHGTMAQGIVVLAWCATSLAVAIKARLILDDHLQAAINQVAPRTTALRFDAGPSRLMTLLFGIYYLQYQINQCVESATP
jgi:Domain of unknown function (DUF4234)